jgi:hypothetical protein
VFNIDPLFIESGTSMGFVLRRNDSVAVPDFGRLPLHNQSSDRSVCVNPQNTTLVALVPHNTTKGSYLNFKEVPFLLLSLNFKLVVELDYRSKNGKINSIITEVRMVR